MPTKEEVIPELLEWHFQVDPHMVKVYRFLSANEDDPREPIKFLEVSPDTPASGSVMPFTFGGTEDLPYSTMVATITPDEMEQVRRGEIALPTGWDLTNSIVYQASQYKSQEGRKWRRSKEIVRSPIFFSNGSKPFRFRVYRTRPNSTGTML